MSRKLYLIAGPNGSGKTTLAKELIKEEKVTFLNADEIANQWELYYNGENSYELVARGCGDILEIMDDALYNKFKKEAK